MNDFVSAAIGSPSPIGPQEEGAVIMGGQSGIDLIMSFSSPSGTMIEMVQSAPMKAGIATIDGIATALLVWRFDGGKPLTMGNPINICLDPNPDRWRIPERGHDEHFPIRVALQDGGGILRATRTAFIPPKLMTAIEMAQTRQITLGLMGWHAGMFDAEVAMLYRRWPKMRDALRDAVSADLKE
ncbi:MAG: hypothetical protein HY985_03280 [Magnetospirillum sp.]|nr:hypothetical protein [Magnetospirillum sp.]